MSPRWQIGRILIAPSIVERRALAVLAITAYPQRLRLGLCGFGGEDGASLRLFAWRILPRRGGALGGRGDCRLESASPRVWRVGSSHGVAAIDDGLILAVNDPCQVWAYMLAIIVANSSALNVRTPDSWLIVLVPLWMVEWHIIPIRARWHGYVRANTPAPTGIARRLPSVQNG